VLVEVAAPEFVPEIHSDNDMLESLTTIEY
jgi:hypothetical protein